MIEPERAGSARHTAKNDCASSVRRIWCGGASVTMVTAWPEKSYCAAHALDSLFAIPATKHPYPSVTPKRPFHALRLPGGDRALSDDGYAVMTAMRQLGRPHGKSSKGEMSKIGFTEPRGLLEEELRPTRPPGRSGPMDRTAGGIGGAAPASLDSYGHSRTDALKMFYERDRYIATQRGVILFELGTENCRCVDLFCPLAYLSLPPA